MGSHPAADLAQRTLRAASGRWSDQSPDMIETTIGGLIGGYARHHPLQSVVLRMHPTVWPEVKIWVCNVCSRWPPTCAVKIVCNTDQDPSALTLSAMRLAGDERCELRRGSKHGVTPRSLERSRP